MIADMNLRPALTTHLLQRVRAFQEGFRHNLALLGPPGIGKTFQLQQVMGQLPEGMAAIYCPVYRESSRSFLTRLSSAILQAGLDACGPRPASLAAGIERLGAERSLETLLTAAQPCLPKTADALRHVERLLNRRALADAFSSALDAVAQLNLELRRPGLFILDEFLFLEDLGFSHAFNELGKRVMTWPSTQFVLASSSPVRARRILRERFQLLFGQFELITVDSLDASRVNTWMQWELRPLCGSNETLMPFLNWWLGPYPWYLHVLVRRLREQAALRQVTELSEGLFLRAAWDVLGSADGPLYQWCVRRLEPLEHVVAGGRAVEALLQLAEGARTATAVGQRIGRGGLAQALETLSDYDLAQRTGTCWIVPDPVLRCWVSTVLSMHRAEAGWNPEQLRERLAEYLRGLWRAWIERSQRTLTEHVTELLTSFEDELVCLDEKTGRLPQFERIEPQSEPGYSGTFLLAEAEGRRWCYAIADEPVTEEGIVRFETFCRSRQPKPVRKVLVASQGLDENAKVLAKASNMWVWGARELDVLRTLYHSTHELGAHATR